MAYAGTAVSISDQVERFKAYVSANATRIQQGAINTRDYQKDFGVCLVSEFTINHFMKMALKDESDLESFAKTSEEFTKRIHTFFDVFSSIGDGSSKGITSAMITLQKVELLAYFIFGVGGGTSNAELLLNFLKDAATCNGHNTETEFGFYDAIHDPELVNLALRYVKLNVLKSDSPADEPETYLDTVNYHIWRLNYEKWQASDSSSVEPSGPTYGKDHLFTDMAILKDAISAAEQEMVKPTGEELLKSIEDRVGLIISTVPIHKVEDLQKQIDGKVWYFHHKNWEDSGREGVAPGGETWGFDHREDDLEIYQRAVDDVAKELSNDIEKSPGYLATIKKVATIDVPSQIGVGHPYDGETIFKLLSLMTSSSLSKADFDLCYALVEQLCGSAAPHERVLHYQYLEENLSLFDMALRFIALGNSSKDIFYKNYAEICHSKWMANGSEGEEPAQTKEYGGEHCLEDKEVFRQALIQTEVAEYGRVKTSFLSEIFPKDTPVWPTLEEVTGYGKGTVFKGRVELLMPSDREFASPVASPVGSSVASVDSHDLDLTTGSGVVSAASVDATTSFMPITGNEDEEVQLALLREAESRAEAQRKADQTELDAALALSLEETVTPAAVRDGVTDSPDTLSALFAAEVASGIALTEDEKSNIRAMRAAARS